MAQKTQRIWTEKERLWLAEKLREGLSYDEIAAQSTRTTSSIKSMGRKLGGAISAPEAPPLGGPRWSEEDRQLAAMMIAMGITYAQVGKALGRSGGTIGCMVSRGRLPVAIDVERLDKDRGDGRPWTDDEDVLIDTLSRRGLRAAEIAVMIRRTAGSVEIRKCRLGVAGPRFAAKQKPDGSWRPCMCCRRSFRSEGIHNRICLMCKDSDLWD